jgi:FHS family L-fucose permease-like MFS transporter
VLGLTVVACGFIANYLGVTAALGTANVYTIFLCCMSLVALGVVMLQLVANPYVMVLGAPESGAFRMTLSQALNSVATTVAPIFITSVILAGETPAPELVPAPFMGLGIFTLLICLILVFMKLPKIDEGAQSKEFNQHPAEKSSVFAYPHVWLGAVAIFMYMGVEIGVPSMLPYRFQKLGIDSSDVVTSYLAFYWGGMMVGRFVGAGILTKFKPRVLLSSCVSLGALCILLSLFFADSMFGIWLMLAAGLFHSVMWPLIFNLGLMHLGRHTKAASGIINTGVIGAAVLMPIMGAVVDFTGVIIAMCVMFVYYAYIFWFCNWGSNIGLSDRK